MLLVGWLPLVAACSFEPGADVGEPGDPDGGMLPPDGSIDPDGPLPPDAAPPDAPPPPPGVHLLLTEVKTQPSNSEFIEIWNPLEAEISLRDYYLTDDHLYQDLPAFDRLGLEIPVGTRDAVLRFPEGAVIGGGEVIVIALDEEGYGTAFGGGVPSFTLRPGSIPAAPVMEVVADGSSSMELTDDGEPIILFRWDGESDLVTDVDIVRVGFSEDTPDPPGGEDGVPDKTGEDIDGPDADSDDSTYAPDGAEMPNMSFRSGNTGSHKRRTLEGAAEPETGSNGVDGHDETSEDTLTTWEQVDSAPTPGDVPTLAAP